MSRIDELEEARPPLFPLAHRIPGDDDRTCDAVEETRLRREAATATHPARTRKHLAAEVTGICAAVLRSARPRQDIQPGPRPSGVHTVRRVTVLQHTDPGNPGPFRPGDDGEVA